MVCLFFFKQKTAYELRISDWSSDVCSSDLLVAMLELVERGGIDQVLADTSSRIARNQGDAHHIRDRINFAGARIFTLADGEINALTGGIKGLLDEQQRKDLGHNIRRAQRGRSEERRVGKECVSTCRSRCSP